MISRQIELHRLATGRRPRVTTALTLTKQYLFKYQGYISAALVLGGVDKDGPQLFTIHPAGSTDKLPYVTMGSGSLAAMAVFESRWKPDMTVRGARQGRNEGEKRAKRGERAGGKKGGAGEK